MEPGDWKPMTTVGVEVREIRMRKDGGAFGVLCVAQIGDAVVVLHAFRKKTQKTEKRDLDLAASKLRTSQASKEGSE